MKDTQGNKYSYVDDVYTIIYGFLVKSYGKVQLTKFNKLVDEYYTDEARVDMEELYDIADNINTSTYHQTLFDRVIKGGIELSDIVNEESYADNKIKGKKEILKLLSPTISEQERVREQNREFNKIQKDGAFFKNLLDDIKEDMLTLLKEQNFFIPKESKDLVYPKEGTLIINHSDWHIGATVRKTQGQGYNYDIFTERMAKYKQEAKSIIDNKEPNKIVLTFLGDLIENTLMRNYSQALDCEFNLSEQISIATREVVRIIKYYESFYKGDIVVSLVHGNHDRLVPNKKDDIYNQSAVYIVLDTLLLLKENGFIGDNVEIIDNREDINLSKLEAEKYILWLEHGDKITRNTGIVELSEDVDILLVGHLHSFQVKSEKGSRLKIQVGTTQGSDSYSKQNKFPDTKASQTILYLTSKDEGRPIEFYHVFLD